jgi:DMSO/TMAO reductase YedYZ heme-binding membrane subunit
MQSQNQSKRLSVIIVVSYYIIVLLYAYFRYIHFKGLDFAINATFIMNKAFAGAAVLSVFSSYMISSISKLRISFPENFHIYKRYFGLAGFYFMCIHIFFGLRIIKQEVLPQFFETSGDFSLRGQIIIFLGILGFILFLFPAITSIFDIVKKLSKRKWKFFQRVGYFAFAVIFIHTAFIGSENWFKPDNWPGLMPPITMICALLILISIVYRIFVAFKTKYIP